MELIGPDAPEFGRELEILYGSAVDAALQPALPYSVIARNETERTIGLLGIRFDMTGARGHTYSVIHYADSLRNAEKADLRPGARRFVCAEPLYTELVLWRRRGVDRRSEMNLANLRKVLRIRAALDCVAFDDGQFAGPDSNGAFERLAKEREIENEFVREVLGEEAQWGGTGTNPKMETFLERAMDMPGRRILARRFYEGLQAGGPAEVLVRARNHRCRVVLWR